MQTDFGAELSIHTDLTVAVEERKDDVGVWTVEAINVVGDGEIYQTFFAGPEAKERAYEYARSKYAFAG